VPARVLTGAAEDAPADATPQVAETDNSDRPSAANVESNAAMHGEGHLNELAHGDSAVAVVETGADETRAADGAVNHTASKDENTEEPAPTESAQATAEDEENDTARENIASEQEDPASALAEAGATLGTETGERVVSIDHPARDSASTPAPASNVEEAAKAVPDADLALFDNASEQGDHQDGEPAPEEPVHDAGSERTALPAIALFEEPPAPSAALTSEGDTQEANASTDPATPAHTALTPGLPHHPALQHSAASMYTARGSPAMAAPDFSLDGSFSQAQPDLESWAPADTSMVAPPESLLDLTEDLAYRTALPHVIAANLSSDGQPHDSDVSEVDADTGAQAADGIEPPWADIAADSMTLSPAPVHAFAQPLEHAALADTNEAEHEVTVGSRVDAAPAVIEDAPDSEEHHIQIGTSHSGPHHINIEHDEEQGTQTATAASATSHVEDEAASRAENNAAVHDEVHSVQTDNAAALSSTAAPRELHLTDSSSELAAVSFAPHERQPENEDSRPSEQAVSILLTSMNPATQLAHPPANPVAALSTEARIEALAAQQARLERDVAILSSQTADINAKASTMTSGHDGDTKVLRDKNTELSAHCAHLTKSLLAAQTERSALGRYIEQLSQQIVELQTRCAALQDDKHSASQQMAEHQRDLDEMKDALRQQMEHSAAAIEELAAELQSARQAVAGLTASQEDQLQEHAAEIARLKQVCWFPLAMDVIMHAC
jgi:hypothetical protein